MNKISVIVPVYNRENYIQECINSILQTQYHDLEIVIVDDGSTDSSVKICEKIAQENSCVQFHKQSNQGPSAARNLGISKATGEYIAFVDSDDYVTGDIYDRLLGNLLKHDADIAAIGMNRVYEEENKIIPYYDNDANLVLDKNQAIEKFFENHQITFSLCDKLFKKELLNNIMLDESIKMCEDQKFIFDVLQKVNRVVYDAKPCYNIRCTKGSLARSKATRYHLSMLNVNDYIIQKVKDDKKLYIKALQLQTDLCISYFIPNTINNPEFKEEDIQRIKHIINSYSMKCFVTASVKLKIKILLYYINKRMLLKLLYNKAN